MLLYQEIVSFPASSEILCCDLVVKQDLIAKIDALNRSQMKNTSIWTAVPPLQAVKLVNFKDIFGQCLVPSLLGTKSNLWLARKRRYGFLGHICIYVFREANEKEQWLHLDESLTHATLR